MAMIFVKRIAAVVLAAVVAALPSVASATALDTGTPTSMTIGNLLITNTACTASGTASCSTTTWGINPATLSNAGPGSISVVLTPLNPTIWTGGAGNDLNLTFEIQSLTPGGSPSTLLSYINGVGMTASGTGAVGQGFSVVATPSNLSVGNGIGTLNGDPSAPGNSISFAPQSAVLVNFDVGVVHGTGTITGVNLYVSHAPEPATLGLLLFGGAALAGVRRRARG